MQRSRVPRLRALVAATALAALAGSLSGCSAGFDATSVQPYAAADGVNGRNASGSLRVLNALVVAPEGSTSGMLIMAVANRGNADDRVTGVTSPGATVALDGETELPAGGSVIFGGSGGSTAPVSELTVEPGREIALTVSFARSEPITVRTLVQPATGDYASVAPAPATATTTPSP